MRHLGRLLALLLLAPVAAAHDFNGIAVDGRDRVHVVDSEDGQVWAIDPQGEVSVVLAGTTDPGTCRHTHHLAFDTEGTLWLPSG